MSSKTQYKDALKRANRANSELKKEITIANNQLRITTERMEKLKKAFNTIDFKKWWQFWK